MSPQPAVVKPFRAISNKNVIEGEGTLDSLEAMLSQTRLRGHHGAHGVSSLKVMVVYDPDPTLLQLTVSTHSFVKLRALQGTSIDGRTIACVKCKREQKGT
jgi:hypothetical protein